MCLSDPPPPFPVSRLLPRPLSVGSLLPFRFRIDPRDESQTRIAAMWLQRLRILNRGSEGPEQGLGSAI